MDGDPTDNNAKLFAQGYNGVLEPKFDRRHLHQGRRAGRHVGSADGPTTFQQQFTAHPNINAVVTPNDDNANAVIAVLKSNGDPGRRRSRPPVRTRRSRVCRTSSTGYQCGTVYKPIYLEAQAAAALALYLRAGLTPPSTLVNSTTKDSTIGAGRRVGLHHRRSG